MKHPLHILILCLVMCFLFLSCSYNHSKEPDHVSDQFQVTEQPSNDTENVLLESLIIPNDNETVILSIQPDTLTAIGTTLTIQNNSSLECFYGSDFMIEKKEDDKWYSINFIADFTAEEFVLSPNSSTEMNIQWEKYYGALPYGEYRILKEINIDNTNSYYCCEFNILP